MLQGRLLEALMQPHSAPSLPMTEAAVVPGSIERENSAALGAALQEISSLLMRLAQREDELQAVRRENLALREDMGLRASYCSEPAYLHAAVASPCLFDE